MKRNRVQSPLHDIQAIIKKKKKKTLADYVNCSYSKSCILKVVGLQTFEASIW